MEKVTVSVVERWLVQTTVVEGDGIGVDVGRFVDKVEEAEKWLVLAVGKLVERVILSVVEKWLVQTTVVEGDGIEVDVESFVDEGSLVDKVEVEVGTVDAPI